MPRKIHVFIKNWPPYRVYQTSHLLLILPMNKWSSKSIECYWSFSIPHGHFRKRLVFWCFQGGIERYQLHEIYQRIMQGSTNRSSCSQLFFKVALLKNFSYWSTFQIFYHSLACFLKRGLSLRNMQVNGKIF